MCMVNVGDKGQRGHRECIGVGVAGYMRGGGHYLYNYNPLPASKWNSFPP